ncbi:protein MAIN-LIKE 1-like [Glycine soja]|uniref:protein MAIN-LIKE 1-like n=1 Tax=Glycine soja TaxID=3848 RepID=UPI00103D7705|nr:protein MAIN-LIKE 1-like [Glycine soja]
MVKTRGLCCALGRVVAKGLGRRDGDDSDEAEPVVAGNEPMVDFDAHDTGAETDTQDTGAKDVANEAEGFPGGPRDPSVLTEYAEHVVANVWSGKPLYIDEAMLMLVELLMVSLEVAIAETGQCCGPYVCLYWLRDIYQRKCQTQHWTTTACAYLLHLLGYTLFFNKSATHAHVVFLDALRDLTRTRRYAWGAAGLVHMYDHLNDSNIRTS